MSKNKKLKPFSKVSAVKSNARDRVGQPKSTQIIIPKFDKSPKYKKSLRDLIDETLF